MANGQRRIAILVAARKRSAPRGRVMCVLAGTLALTAAAPDAVALWGDRLELFVAESATHDDNVFRLSEESDPASVLGTDSTADWYHTTSFGVDFDVPVSAQRFVGNVTYDRYRFNEFTELDFEGYSQEAYWLWKIGDHADGRFGYAKDRQLTSLANLQTGIQSSTPNLLTAGETLFDMTYNPARHWRVRGAVTKLRQSNSAPEFQLSDARINLAQFTATFVTASGNEIGFRARADDGYLPNEQLVAGRFVDNSYEQRSVAAVLDRAMTERSRLRLEVGRVERTYPQLPQRDFADSMVNASYEWGPTDDFTLLALGQRDISRNEQVNVGFVFVKALALQPTFELTEKTSLAVYVELSEREYRGDAALALAGLGASARLTERLSSARLSLFYAPTSVMRLGFVLRREERDASAAYADYGAAAASLELRLTF